MLLIILHLVLYAGSGVIFFSEAGKKNQKRQVILYAALGVVCGLGFSSSLFFLFLVAGGSFYLQSIVEILACTMIIFFGVRKHKLSLFDFNVLKFSVKSLWKKSNLPVFFFLLLLFIIMAYCFVVELYKPNGDWDAYAIWNAQARVIYRGGNYWTNLFHGGYSHSDYPLLLAGLIAHWWFMLGYETIYVPMAIALITIALVCLILFSALSQFKSFLHALVAIMILTGTPLFLDHGSSQYADTMLSLFFLTSCVFLTLAERSGHTKEKYLIMAGLTAGFAVWTKNEGVLFLLAVFSSQILFAKKDVIKRILYLAIGAFSIFVIALYFKLALAPPNDLVNGQSEIWKKLVDLKRYYYICARFKETLLYFGSGILSPYIILITYALITGKDRHYRYKSHQMILFILFMVMFGYFMVYVITPHDLKWHIDTSLDRLMIQLLPALVFGFFLYLKEPDHFLFRSELT